MKLRRFSSFSGLKKPLRKEKRELETIEILRFRRVREIGSESAVSLSPLWPLACPMIPSEN